MAKSNEEEKKEEVVPEASPVLEEGETPIEAASPTDESALKEALENQEQATKASQERYLRTLADFENYKKRAQKEQIEQIKFANERLLKETLPIIDNLERAILHSKENSDSGKILEGVVMIQKQLFSILEKFGVRPITSVDQPFDPNHHQSVGQVEVAADSDVQENQVVTEAQKGYFLNDRVLRPSLVIVAKKKQSSSIKDGEGV